MDKSRKKQFEADMMLILVTLGWGVSYFMMDLCLKEISPLTLNSYRFLGAFAIAVIIAFRKVRHVSRMTLAYAFFVSIALAFAYIGAIYGVKYTTQSNAGFFCATSTVFTPIMAYIFKKVVPGRKLGVVIVLCFIGIALMSLDADFHIAVGDLLCIMCGFAYAFDLLITETAVSHEEVDAFQLGVYQLGFTGVWMLILALLFEEPTLPQTAGCWASTVFLSVFCTGVAFIMQTIAQQYTTATHVGIIFALEPVFAGIVAFLFAGERLLPRAYAGAAIMLLSLLIMEIDIGSLFKKKKIPNE